MPILPKPLNVIALISGGKDSIYSLLHVLSLGHRVVALGNLYPTISPATPHVTSPSSSHADYAIPPDAPDPDSHMYQTAGHALIPLIAQALRLPLFRAPIAGSVLVPGLTYAPSAEGDETESLLPLLRAIKDAHPEANALSTGAILSTYQRTRIESVALRVGLMPLSFLWQYPSLFRAEGEDALLAHMGEVGMEARIVKVASGGLGEGELWVNVASVAGRGRIGRLVGRFGGEGGVIGEGGEYETVVVGGGREWWKGRVEVTGRRVVKGEGGVAWVVFEGGKVVDLNVEEGGKEEVKLRRPGLLEESFEGTLRNVMAVWESESEELNLANEEATALSTGAIWMTTAQPGRSTWTIVPQSSSTSSGDAAAAMFSITTELSALLTTHNLAITDVISTTILLRDMADFSAINAIYSQLFTAPNPPSRACVAIGPLLPPSVLVVMHLTLVLKARALPRRALHIQSRSYWAPANIGPYSQAQCAPLDAHSNMPSVREIECVHIAGQIPLVPATMEVVSPIDNPIETIQPASMTGIKISLQTILALQHLWRIAVEMSVVYFTSGTAFLSRSSLSYARRRARIAGLAWEERHKRPADAEDSDGEEIDLWELRNRRGEEIMGVKREQRRVPEWNIIEDEGVGEMGVSPFWAAEVEALPRGVDIEWLAKVGIVGEDVRMRSRSCGGGGVHECVVGEGVVVTTVFVAYESRIENLGIRVTELGGLLEGGTVLLEVTSGEGGCFRAEQVYLDAGIEGVWSNVVGGNVVPCRSLWDRRGSRLAAVLVFRSLLVS